MKENIYGVIMAGGEGKRLWPISTKEKGKQILNLYGNKNMLNTTIDRIKEIIPYENIYVIISKSQEKVIKSEIDSHILEKNILVEPFGKNTAACIAYAGVEISDAKGIMCVFSADHYIPDVASFQKTVKRAIEVAVDNNLVTIGITPSFPSTDFGYIKCKNENKDVELVEKFVEKPDKQTAREYIESGKYLWNSGIFVWKIEKILKEIKEKIPNTYKKFNELEENKEREDKNLQKIYESIESISIDVGVLEKCHEIKVVKGNFEWMDIGNWDTITCVMNQDEKCNNYKGKCILKDAKNTMIYNTDKGKTVIGIGLEDLMIINTEDKILILPKKEKKRIEEISEIIEKEEDKI